MARGPEGVFRDRTRKLLNKLSNSWWESIQQKSIHGTPDVIGCVAGQFVALEYKASKRSTKGKLQVHKAEKIIRAGGTHFFVYPDNWDEVYDCLKKMSQLSR